MWVQFPAGKTRRKSFLCIALVWLLLVSGCRDTGSAGDFLENHDAVIASIRQGLHDHAKTIHVRFSTDADVLETLNEKALNWVEEALAETGVADEGDYIRYQCGGYAVSSTRTAGSERRFAYTVDITPTYYTYYVEEEAVGEKVSEILQTLHVEDLATDYAVLRALYTYLCANVRYDQVHVRHATHTYRSTAYAALVRGSATCQGYCVALYRLLHSCGIDCRVVTGHAGEQEIYHAWLLVCLDRQYYAIDPTWDSEHGGQTDAYAYFLYPPLDFPSHTMDAAFCTQAFTSRYPFASAPYTSTG